MPASWQTSWLQTLNPKQGSESAQRFMLTSALMSTAGVHLSDGRQLATDLVVDASGRNSQTPAWLDAAGFDKPPEVRFLRVALACVLQGSCILQGTCIIWWHHG